MITQWHKCYDEGWKGLIVPEAFSHPAKMAYGLLKRILAHVKIQGWLKEGDVIVDPFGGIGSTGILGAYEGYQCVCCELERKFVDLARKNFELHLDAWVEFGNPYPFILQGDSRRLCEVVELADCIVSSPPWENQEGSMQSKKFKAGSAKMLSERNAEGITKGHYATPAARKRAMDKANQQDYGNSPGQLGAMKPGKVDLILSSPPYAEAQTTDKNSKRQAESGYWDKSTNKKLTGKYSEQNGQNSKGNLGNLKSGDIDAIISSPPYAESMSSEKSGIDWSKCKREDGTPRDMTKEPAHKTRAGAGGEMRYGPGKENLGNLKSGDVDCVISSPPFEGVGMGITKEAHNRQVITGKVHTHKDGANLNVIQYGETNGNIGNDKGDTFWQAAKAIVEQCHQILKPGGHAIWVVKSFVRKGKIVDFPGDWQRLCESVGFKTVCVHQAMLVKETKHQTLFGDTEIKRKERKSFFRRLAESKGSPRIDFEVVLCMVKGL